MATINSQVIDGTATFTYKVSANVSGGEYTIRASNNYYMPDAVKFVRIRDYPRDQLLVKTDLPLETYRPGDTVTGQIKVE